MAVSKQYLQQSKEYRDSWNKIKNKAKKEKTGLAKASAEASKSKKQTIPERIRAAADETRKKNAEPNKNRAVPDYFSDSKEIKPKKAKLPSAAENRKALDAVNKQPKKSKINNLGDVLGGSKKIEAKAPDEAKVQKALKKSNPSKAPAKKVESKSEMSNADHLEMNKIAAGTTKRKDRPSAEKNMSIMANIDANQSKKGKAKRETARTDKMLSKSNKIAEGRRNEKYSPLSQPDSEMEALNKKYMNAQY